MDSQFIFKMHVVSLIKCWIDYIIVVILFLTGAFDEKTTNKQANKQ